MNNSRDILVKVNYKNIGELNSFIYNNVKSDKNDKYVMCAGKYDKTGWTIVFKAKNMYEAEEILNRNSERRDKILSDQIIEDNKVLIPSWMQ